MVPYCREFLQLKNVMPLLITLLVECSLIKFPNMNFLYFLPDAVLSKTLWQKLFLGYIPLDTKIFKTIYILWSNYPIIIWISEDFQLPILPVIVREHYMYPWARLAYFPFFRIIQCPDEVCVWSCGIDYTTCSNIKLLAWNLNKIQNIIKS